MLERILSMFPVAGNRQYPMKYMRMISCIKTRSVLAKRRYQLAHPIKTQGMEFFKYLCTSMDYTSLDKYNSDVDRYTEVIRSSELMIRNTVDPVYTNSIVGGKLVAKTAGIAPYEVLLNCDCLNPLAEYPFDAPWSSGRWQNLRGIRILYHDSLELPEDFAKSTLNFTKQKPSFLVISVNISILRFKYYKYLKHCESNNVDPDIDVFLKDFEYKSFFDDIFDIWILNLLTRVLSSPTDSVEDIFNDVTVSIRYCTKNMLIQGIEGIVQYADLLRQGSIRPQEFLITEWFGNRNILDIINDNCVRWTQLEPGTRHAWLRAVRDIPYFALLISIIRTFPDSPLKDAVNIRCKELWTLRIKPVAMPNTVMQPILGDFLRTWQDALSKFLEGGSIEMPFSKKTT